MSENRNCFTIIWTIKNFSFNRTNIISPYFCAMDEIKWLFSLFCRTSNVKDCISLYLERADEDSGPNQCALDYELAFISNDESVLHSEIYCQRIFEKGDYYREDSLCVNKDEVYLLKKDMFIPEDILTIRCRMWDRHKLMSQPGRCFGETRIETESRTFIGVVNNFSHIETSSIILVWMKSPSTENLSSMNLCIDCDGNLVMEIEPLKDGTKNIYMHITLFIEDVFGNKVKCGKGKLNDKSLQSIKFSLTKEHLMENKELYLPNDILTLQCDVIFPTGKTTEEINKPEYGFDCEDTRNSLSNGVSKPDSEVDRMENLTTLQDDWISMFKSGLLCDATVKTATEAFSVHSIVLIARSPVLKSWFTSETRDETNYCVDIDDLDADTVRRVLLFMYSGTLEDLQYESAKSLYLAAVKYNIESLRRRCSNFLKQSLLDSNCCDILLLAEKHQDVKLKSAVQDYIARNDEKVIFSDDWKNLEKSHSQITTEIFRFIYLKNRKN